MGKVLFVSLFFLTLISICFAQPIIEWERSYGGTDYDKAYDIQQTSDWGYIVVGYVSTGDSGIIGYHGGKDLWVVKLYPTGEMEWQKTLGGSDDEIGYSVQQTSDDGYIIAGKANSTDGDVTGNHGFSDYWVVKLNALGSLEWQRSIGGSTSDYAYSIQQTMDGGYIVVGESWSSDGDATLNYGGNDYWVVKLDSVGSVEWEQSLGGTDVDYAYDVQQTIDGGYIVGGSVASNDSDVTGNHGNRDYWIVKLDTLGSILWSQCLGGSEDEYFRSIQQTDDLGYIVAGYSNSDDGDVTDNYGEYDYWVVKLDSVGSIEWQKSLGGSSNDWAQFVYPTEEGKYIVVGQSRSDDGHVSENHGGDDYWIASLNAFGRIEWEDTYGGSLNDVAYSIDTAFDGGWIVGGCTSSRAGDVSENMGAYDFWIVKLSPSIDFDPPEVRYAYPSAEVRYLSCPEVEIIFSLWDYHAPDPSYSTLVVNGVSYTIADIELCMLDDTLMVFNWGPAAEGDTFIFSLYGIADTMGNIDSSFSLGDTIIIDRSPPFLVSIEPATGCTLYDTTVSIKFRLEEVYGELDTSSLVISYEGYEFGIDNPCCSFLHDSMFVFSMNLRGYVPHAFQVCLENICDQARGCDPNCMIALPVCVEYYYVGDIPVDIQLELTNVNVHLFPTVEIGGYVTDELGYHILGLNESHFELSEDGYTVADIDVTGRGLSSVLDVILVVDDTGSMGSIIGTLIDNFEILLYELRYARGDYRLGLVTYEQSVDFDGTRFGLGYGLTANTGLFMEMLESITFWGPGILNHVCLDAICDGLNHLELRPAAKPVIIVVTDAYAAMLGDGTAYSDLTLEGTVDSLHGYNAICYVIGAERFADIFRGPGTMTDETGGIWFDIEYARDHMDSVLTKIVEHTVGSYTFTYTSPDLVPEDIEREVIITVDYGGLRGLDTIYYTVPLRMLTEIIEPLEGYVSSNPFQTVWIDLIYNYSPIDSSSIALHVDDIRYTLDSAELSLTDMHLQFTPTLEYEESDSVPVFLEPILDDWGRPILDYDVDWYFKIDYTPPFIVHIQPPPGDTIRVMNPIINIIVQDEISSIDLSSILLEIEGTIFDLASPGFTWIEPETLRFNPEEAWLELDFYTPIDVELVRMCDEVDYWDPNCYTSAGGWVYYYFPSGIEEESVLPVRFSVGDPYPNPFSEKTVISYQLSISPADHSFREGWSGQFPTTLSPKKVAQVFPINFQVFDIHGELIDSSPCPGSPGSRITRSPSIVWQPDPSLSSGIYFVRVGFGEQSITKRVVYLR